MPRYKFPDMKATYLDPEWVISGRVKFEVVPNELGGGEINNVLLYIWTGERDAPTSDCYLNLDEVKVDVLSFNPELMMEKIGVRMEDFIMTDEEYLLYLEDD